jgi:ribosomal protein S18 acetylase RimI-like enzyme
VNIRPATTADRDALHELWDEFQSEVPEHAGFAPDTWEDDWKELQAHMADGGGAVFAAEDDGELVGFLEAAAPEPARWHVETVHVRAGARRRGVAKELLRACAASAREHGVAHLSLEVLTSNQLAEGVWRRLGFEPVELLMIQSLDALEARLGDAPEGPSRASTHVQTDDRTSVERAVGQFIPRLDDPDVHDASGGWIRIVDPVFDVDRDAHSRFARDLSDRLGAVVVALALERGAVVRLRLYERGRMVDEYLSVPTYYSDLDMSDQLALEANPTLVARLTGADREEVRRVAQTADSPADLPPAESLYADLARVMGLEVDR